MENTSYALHIVVGVLIALMILSIIVFLWSKIGISEKSKDEVLIVKNRAEFNAEYEAFNKPLMYGTDVLSCLNKAQNNNQKYVYNNYYGTDSSSKDAREEYFMNVTVKINSPLIETVRAYCKKADGNYERVVGPPGNNNYKKIFVYKYFENPDVHYYYFEKGKVYEKVEKYTTIMGINTGKSLYELLTNVNSSNSYGAGTYELIASDERTGGVKIAGEKGSAMLAALVTTVSMKNLPVYRNPEPTSFGKEDWYYCERITAASDFKTRKFKCTGTVYNDKTGYIEKISFEEVTYH